MLYPNLKASRLASGHPVAMWARLFGVTCRTWHRWECGQTKAPANVLLLLFVDPSFGPVEPDTDFKFSHESIDIILSKLNDKGYDAAARYGVSTQTLWRWRTGKSRPPRAKLSRLIEDYKKFIDFKLDSDFYS